MKKSIYGLTFVLLIRTNLFAEDNHPSQRSADLRAKEIQRLEQASKELDISMPESEKRKHLSEIELIIQDKKYHNPTIAPRVREFLQDGSPTVRSDAIGILARLEDKNSAEEIEKLAINDSDLSVRRIAIEALAMCSKK